jgi:hypothetical protein
MRAHAHQNDGLELFSPLGGGELRADAQTIVHEGKSK